MQQLARRQDGAGLLRRDRLAVHRPEPAEPHQLRDPAGIVAVRLHRHRLEGFANVPRFQQLDRKPCVSQTRIQPLRQGACLQPDPFQYQTQRPEPGDQRRRLARNLRLAQNLACPIDKANARAFQRHVIPA
ncbi:hypothetical protein ACVIIY_004696 [Bradyrhizobium sp. USDA 4515]